MFIAVEGPTDIIYLKNLAKALLADNLAVPDLEELELNGLIMFVPLGGSTVGLWSHRLQGFGRPEFHLCDRDNEPPLLPKYNDHLTRVNARHGCVAVATTRREIENYVHHEAINEALAELGIPLTFASPFTHFADVPALLKNEVNLVMPEGSQWGVRRAKEFLGLNAVRHMTLKRLEEIDPESEVLGWFQTMQRMLDSV
jgi:hypothetical protein